VEERVGERDEVVEVGRAPVADPGVDGPADGEQADWKEESVDDAVRIAEPRRGGVAWCRARRPDL
jgi:hypothetical protein